MHSINILDYSIKSSQGDIKETLDAIKNAKVKVSSKEVPTLDSKITIPYFLFQDEVKADQNSVLSAIRDVVKPILDKLSKEEKEKTAIIIGTALVDMNVVDSIEDSAYEEQRKPYYTSKKSIDTYAKDLAHEFGLNDFTMTINTACTSSINAVLEARNLINSGVFDNAIVIGVEIFSQMMSSGFSSMKLLSSDFQRPFDISRDGLVLGEAVAAVLVGKGESLWSVKGGYSNCNSLNITSVSPDGGEYADVMKRAMEFSNVDVKNITALKAHATSTPTNDLSEINAINKVFDTNTKFTAIKPYIGHTLGACGVLEMAIFMSCIDDGFIPATISHSESIIKEYVPIQEHTKCESGVFMLNYFGFGGNNTSVIIQKELA